MSSVTARLLADRYRLELRVGRVGDLDEWLGSDSLLDRPVTIFILDADAAPDRRAAFLAGVRSAAGVSHVHLAGVYAADDSPAGAYAVQEWVGGITLADRLAAGDMADIDEVLRNAAGLAEALAALHAAGGRHGAIDATAILYPAAQPAKLSGFGRRTAPATSGSDVADLARVLRRAIGADDSGSATRPGLSAAAARALDAAGSGSGDADVLAAALRAGRANAPKAHRKEWSWGWVPAAAGILLVAVIVAVVGLALRVEPSASPLLFPAPPAPSAQPTAVPPPEPTTVPATTPVPSAAPVIREAAAYDPFGTGGERDRDVPLLHDGDEATAWRTERYFDPLQRIKEGVGITFAMEGTPSAMTVSASEGTAFRVAWAPEIPDDFGEWQLAADTRFAEDPSVVPLPARAGGVWLLWLTELTSQPPDGYYFSHVHEVRFEQ